MPIKFGFLLCSVLALVLSGRPASAVYGYLGAGTKFFFYDLATRGKWDVSREGGASIKNAYLQSLVAAAESAASARWLMYCRTLQVQPAGPSSPRGLGQGYETNSKSNPRQPVCKVKMAPRKCRARN